MLNTKLASVVLTISHDFKINFVHPLYASASLRSASYVTRLQGNMVVVFRITLSTSESRVSGSKQ